MEIRETDGGGSPSMLPTYNLFLVEFINGEIADFMAGWNAYYSL